MDKKISFTNVITVLYILFLFIEILAFYIGKPIIEIVSKSLLIPLLMMLYYSSVKKIDTWYFVALLFVLVGDVFLANVHSKLFLFLGTTCFLIYHFLVLVQIVKFVKRKSLKQVFVNSIPFSVVAFVLFYFLSDGLGDFFNLAIPYSIVMGVSFSVAFQNFLQKNIKSNLLIFLAVFIFLVADCFFVLYRFYDNFALFCILTKALYGLSHYLICSALILKNSNFGKKESLHL